MIREGDGGMHWPAGMCWPWGGVGECMMARCGLQMQASRQAQLHSPGLQSSPGVGSECGELTEL